MEKLSPKRQLVAIMFTDIVGYTALMGQDSAKALELIRISKEIQKPLVEKHNGKWLKEMGDGAMAQFGTALDAVNCSIEIQEIARGKLDAKLRIGIHLGDITIENNDVYGDGVNVASRLESVADPGGIYISDNIEKAIRGQGQGNIHAEYLGEIKLKNVDYGVRTYALQGVGLPIPEIKEDKEISGRLGAELQRRGVFRAGITYLAVSLLLILLHGQVRSWINIPDWSISVLQVGLIILFPVAMYFAWNYERSPEGFVRTTSKQSWRNPYTMSQRKPFTGNIIIVVLLLIILFIFTYPRYFLQSNESATTLTNLPALGKNSIAVIPFENMSNDPDQQYFSDGITEDILNHLAKIQGLRVKSRTSTLQYKKTTKTIPEIGDELGVGYVLEGSVRKAGNQVRITAQLIDVQLDEHVWSDSYDRELTQIFAIQTEVAMEIARILEIKLSSGKAEEIFRTGTEDITAYDYYLRARELSNNFNFSFSPNSLNSIIELLQQAISMDPGFVEAYALLSRTLYEQGFLLLREIWLDSALALANKAIELGPNIADGYVIRAVITNWSLGEKLEAGKDFEKAFELEPNDPFVLQRLGTYLIENNDPDRGVPMIVQSVELNWSKKDPQYYLEWGNIYRYAGELDKSRDLYLQAEKLDPEWNPPKNQLGFISFLEGDYYGAIDYYSKADNVDNIAWNYYRAGDLDKAEEYWLQLLEGEKDLEDTTEYFAVRHRLGMVYWDKGDKEKAMQYFNEQIRLNQRDIDQHQIPAWIGSLTSSYYDLALTKAYMGDTEEALNIIENEDIFWAGPLGMYIFLDTDPMLEPVRNDPRFIAVADRWRNKAEAANKIFRQIIQDREASEQMKLEMGK